MSEIVTLNKNSPEFEKYLLGTFSKKMRALPVQSLNVNTDQETVTFKIVSLSEIDRPLALLVWLKTIKPRNFLYILFPLFLVLSKNLIDRTIQDVWTLIFSTLGVIYLYISLSLRSDYLDHMKGIDRINPEMGSQSIQKGWLTASRVRFASTLFAIMAFLCSLPVFIAFPQILIFLLATFFIGIVAFFSPRWSFKEFVGGEILIFILGGPLLVTGYEVALAGSSRLETLMLGFVWGWLAAFPQHLKNLENIVSLSQARMNNFVCKLGFDKAKIMIHWWWLLGLIWFLVYHFLYAGFFWFWFYGFILIFISLRFALRLSQLESSLGSEMMEVRKRGHYLFLMLLSLWFIENMWELTLVWKP